MYPLLPSKVPTNHPLLSLGQTLVIMEPGSKEGVRIRVGELGRASSDPERKCSGRRRVGSWEGIPPEDLLTRAGARRLLSMWKSLLSCWDNVTGLEPGDGGREDEWGRRA